jgi:hypothetical protein
MQSNDFSVLQSDIEKELKRYEKWKRALSSQDFFDYIKEKCKKILDELTMTSLNSGNDISNEYSHIYRNSHKIEVDEDKIVISNDALVSLSQILAENYTENSKIQLAQNYADGFDLAKAVEYGTGVVGASSFASAYAGEDGWAYDLNGHGENGWFYRSNGNIYWTKGYTGTLIYERAIQKIDEEVEDWIDEYLENIE